ncbi:serine hydrolase [Paenibacillus sp. YYML68]|uniref:serine hydrolase domain-containing protein n=1 Tax=Paenibacillus sp. YYML68 TaxID=2909250 RepID=UPI002490E653|nr:serine hydrolase domain-containing protein [Paenibacillus sp. YYML68]
MTELSIGHEQLNDKLNKQLHKLTGRRKQGTIIRIEAHDSDWVWTGATEPLQPDSPYFIASTTKLYTSAMVLQLSAQGRIGLHERITVYVDAETMQGLHQYKGVDYSQELTITHLLSHTSGLPDYFQHRHPNGRPLQARLTAGDDSGWTFEQAITWSKTMTPHFAPGTKGKALYTDTNFQLLGRIVEVVTGKPIGEAMRELIFEPLQLTHTYMYTDPSDRTPAPMHYKAKPLQIPHAMTSFGADGSIISTAEECMVFLRAFFEGKLFPLDLLATLYQWNRIFFPLEYGVGLARFKLPRFMSPFQPAPELLGHSGLSGAFAFYSPEHRLYLTGTVNEISSPGTSYQLMLQLLHTCARIIPTR